MPATVAPIGYLTTPVSINNYWVDSHEVLPYRGKVWLTDKTPESLDMQRF